MTTPLLELRSVSKRYPVYDGMVLRRQVGAVQAVDNVSMTLMRGETLAIVGETGCGKSTTARLAMRLIEPTEGQVFFEGRDITRCTRAEMNPLRKSMQIVFQDPYASLNPRMTVGEILSEPLNVHRVGDAVSRKRRVEELLRLVDLAPYHAERYPHQFSGGQRQRVGIARALALSPKLIVCDEPVSALDVSIQAQIVNLLKDLQHRFDFSYLFISHGLAVVRHIADRVGVMYLGQLVEIGSKQDIYRNPRHPYTQALLAAAPDPNPAARHNVAPVAGDIPSAINPPSGCRFHTRCPMAQDRCKAETPTLREMSTGHQAACHFAEDAPVYEAARHTQHPTPGLLMRQAIYANRRAAA